MAQQDVVNQIRENVKEKFVELKSAVMMREKLLLRQLEVINTTRKQQLQSGKREVDIDAGVEFLCENEQELLAAIRNFGRYQLTNLNLAIQDVYLKNEDYIEPTDDHETMFKGLNESVQEDEIVLDGDEGKESIIVDFSHHKSLMEHNAKLMNESIINITLKEAKELIKQAKLKRELPVPPLNLEELDDEVESSIAEVVSSLEQVSSQEQGSDQLSNNKYSQTQQPTTKQKRFKPKITINNCNGTINLRNIASLTINCTTDDKVQAQIPVKYPNPDYEAGEEEVSASSSTTHKLKTAQKSKTLVESLVSSSTNTECTTPTSTSNSNYSSNNSSRSQSTKKPKTKKTHTKASEKLQNSDSKPAESQHNKIDSSTSSMANEVTCDFYNRLLNEIKKSINQQQRVRSKCTTASGATTAAHHNAADSSSSASNYYTGNGGSGGREYQQGRRLVLKNFENLRIILEANSTGDEDSFHPVQIEQWLAEIITDTDLEPMQNTDILEHSKIYTDETTQET